MSTESSSLAFFVKVEGRAHSSHRSPEGIYGVSVVEERTLQHSACAALNIARERVPFLDENQNAYTLRVFNALGDEVVVPRLLHTRNDIRGRFLGRSKDHPKAVTYQ